MLVDSHCHLDFQELNQNLVSIIESAKNNDVAYLQTICTKISKFNEVKRIAETYDNIFCSVGIHPNDIETEEMHYEDQLVNLTKHPKVISIGETGLDYFYEHSPKEMQQKSFHEHIKSSQATQLPIIIHSRDAEDDTYNILAKTQKDTPYPALIHCFTASKEFAIKVLDLGLYISFSGIVTFKNATNLQEIAKTIPLNRLLVETDSPYLAPVPKRGKTNEPSYVKYTTEFLATLLNISYKELSDTTTNNFFTLFSKATR